MVSQAGGQAGRQAGVDSRPANATQRPPLQLAVCLTFGDRSGWVSLVHNTNLEVRMEPRLKFGKVCTGREGVGRQNS